MKTCKICQIEKPLDNFHVNKRQGKGRADECKPCRKTTSAEKYKNNWFHYITILKRSYCKSRNIPFDLDADYLENIWTGVCPVFESNLIRGSKSNDNQSALDRIDPSKGYVKGNVAFISSRANRIKYDASAEELRKVADWIESVTTRRKP